jgi:hypothetical protein
MSSVIEKIKELGLPINSFVSAVHELHLHFGDRTKGDYDFQIAALTNHHVETKHTKHAQLVFGYIVQESIRAYITKTPQTVDELVELASSKALTFLVNNPWNDAETEITTVTTPDGETTSVVTVKNKRGKGPTKRDLSIQLYTKVKDQKLSRQDLINLFVKELGLTPAGASTYVANCRSGAWK